MPLNAELPQLAYEFALQIEGSFKDHALDQTIESVRLIQQRYEALKKHTQANIPEVVKEEFFSMLVDEILGFGPLEQFINDKTVSEIMVNRADQIYVERKGKLTVSEVRFVDDAHVQRVINKIIKPLGRQVNAEAPLVDARLPDGSRVNAMVPPCAIDGPNITIRKFSETPFQISDLIGFGSMTEDMAKFLEACVGSKLNIIVSGGTGSGKTTLLNVLSGFIPKGERIVTIEDAAELNLQQPHVVRLETKKTTTEDPEEITIRDLVHNSLRMRPERIVVGECRGGEALDMLQAMNTGQPGSMTTIHANNPRDTLSRLATLVLMSGMELPLVVVLKQIASAVNLIVQQARLRDGSRKITNITEILGLQGDVIMTQDIYVFNEKDSTSEKVEGQFEATGRTPQYMQTLKRYGYNLPPSMFLSSGGGMGLRR
ncbi:MAG TPA: CpaF family protein [Anaerolineales bacterium]|nr:CpaF family protein [Anaerolineales bacterium]